MKWTTYLKGKKEEIIAFIVVLAITVAMLAAFHVNISCICAEIVILTIPFVLVMLHDYYIRNAFYQDVLSKLEKLDKKYLIAEMIGETEFPEAEILKNSIYEIDKSMIETVNQMRVRNEEFKEYIEMWIHEIKRPLSALTLMNYNGNLDWDKQKELIRRIEGYVEQILFMARADAAEKDYLVKQIVLEKSVNMAILTNKEILIESHVAVIKENLEGTVSTDAKWLEFILGQLIANSVKYAKEQDKKIKFYAVDKPEKKSTILVVEDNGIGIPKSDLLRIFEKSFTGSNGHTIEENDIGEKSLYEKKHEDNIDELVEIAHIRNQRHFKEKATGMGLYICKKLCDKMGHKIWAESEQGVGTKICIEFGKDTYFANRLE